ncbi:Sof1-like protein domain-containing protein [[Candida] zeylanoides]
MKVKTVSRSSDTYVPVRNTQESALPRNLDPALHPFERAREYTKALTATKMERMFAKPFVGQLGDGHRDGVYQVAKNFASTSQVASASADGVIKYWDMTSRRETVSFKAHYGMVSGLCVTPSQGHVMSCGDDKTVKMWSVRSDEIDADGRRGLVKTFLGEHAFKGVDHHQHEGMFVTGGASVQLWDVNRSQYVSNLSWGADNVTNVKFNRTQTNVVASTGSDNSIVLYDVRTNSAVQKVVTSMRTNAVAWNPMEAFNFASASEDHNAYLWDMRRLDRSLNVYKDHVAAVMDVDFSPTGEELVTGSYDKTVRIFGARQGHSRDIYHTKRMQHVFSVRFSTDARYILSGSDDANVRVWRANAAATASVKSSRQRAKLEYDAALKERFKHMPEIRRIAKHRHVPIVVKKAAEIKRVETEALRKRQDNQRRHSKPGAVPYEAERQRHIRGTAIKE